MAGGVHPKDNGRIIRRWKRCFQKILSTEHDVESSQPTFDKKVARRGDAGQSEKPCGPSSSPSYLDVPINQGRESTSSTESAKTKTEPGPPSGPKPLESRVVTVTDHSKVEASLGEEDNVRHAESTTVPPSLDQITNDTAPDVTQPSVEVVLTKVGSGLADNKFPELGMKGETRLVTIESSVNINDPMHCRSEPIALHDERKYDALSHHWSDEPISEDVVIILNSQRVPVQPSLLQAMQALRQQGVKDVWIDVLCIDQSNNEDKERQIKNMHTIYSGATRVYAWIGRKNWVHKDGSIDDKDGERGLDILGGEWPSNRLEELDVKAVQAVATRPYWTRCWIIQELSVAKEAIIMCGSKTADFNAILDNLEKFREHNGEEYVRPDVHTHLESLRNFNRQESAKTRRAQMSLLSALVLSRHSESTCRRDKIYAILSLAHDSRKLVNTPNYSEEVERVFWKLAHRMVHDQGHVAIILLARRRALPKQHEENKSTLQLATKLDGLQPGDASDLRRRTSAPSERRSRMTSQDIEDFRVKKRPLPSWVPFWSELGKQPMPRWINNSVGMPSDQGRPAPLTVHASATTLILHGIPLEQITSISGMPGVAEFNAHQPNYPPSTTANAEPEIGQISRAQTSNSVRDLEGAVSSRRGFTEPSDVVRELWSTIIEPLCEDDNRTWRTVSSASHQCSRGECTASTRNGYAIAKVLLNARDPPIDKWMRTNRTMMIDDKTLEDWLKALLQTHMDRPSFHTEGECDFSRERSSLSEAFENMAKYSMRLAVTSRRTLRLVYCQAKVDDHISKIDGCPLPIVIRPVSLPQQPEIVDDPAVQAEPVEASDDHDDSSDSEAEPILLSCVRAQRNQPQDAIETSAKPLLASQQAQPLSKRPRVADLYQFVGEVFLYLYSDDPDGAFAKAFKPSDLVPNNLVDISIV